MHRRIRAAVAPRTRRSTVRRLMALGTVAAATAGALSGCSVAGSSTTNAGSGSGGDSTGPITLNATVWSDWAFVQEAGVAFKKKYPNVTLQINAIPDGTYYNKIPSLFKSSDAPDISAVAADSVFVPQYIKDGVLAPLDDVWADSGLNSHATAAVKKQYTIGGHQYAINVGQVVIPVVYYNKSLFQKAGIAASDVPETGMTTAQFYAINKKLQAANLGGLTTGMGDGTAAFRYFSPYFTNACGSAWVDKVRSGDTSAWSDSCVASALNVVKEWSDNKVFLSNAVTTGASAAAEATFGAGKAAEEMEGTWAVGAITKAAGSSFQVGWFALPSATSTPIQPSESTVDGMVVNKYSKHLDMAKKFMTFLASYPAIWEHGIPARDDVPAPSGTAPLLTSIASAVTKSGSAVDLQQLTPAAQVTKVNNAINAIIVGSQTPAAAASSIAAG